MEARRKYKFRWTITIISFVMSLVMFGAFLFNIFTRPGETTETLGRSDYSIAAVDATSGKIVESKLSIVSKKLNTIDDLDIDLADDATISYKLFFYDEDEKILTTKGTTGDLTGETFEVPEGAVYFRIMITPAQVDGEPVELSMWNVGKYIKQIEVTFAKD